jgi:hypothetical protein
MSTERDTHDEPLEKDPDYEISERSLVITHNSQGVAKESSLGYEKK